MTCEKFESVMGYHCSPVLMGMKPANLVSFSKEKMPELPEADASFDGGELAWMRRRLPDGTEYILAANIWSDHALSGHLTFGERIGTMPHQVDLGILLIELLHFPSRETDGSRTEQVIQVYRIGRTGYRSDPRFAR